MAGRLTDDGASSHRIMISASSMIIQFSHLIFKDNFTVFGTFLSMTMCRYSRSRKKRLIYLVDLLGFLTFIQLCLCLMAINVAEMTCLQIAINVLKSGRLKKVILVAYIFLLQTMLNKIR